MDVVEGMFILGRSYHRDSGARVSTAWAPSERLGERGTVMLRKMKIRTANHE